MGNRQLLALLGIERAVQRQGDHPQQAIERGTDFMAHVGQKGCACLGHVQSTPACILQLLVGLAQARVAGLELKGACRDDVFQFVEVFGQAVFGVAPLLDFGGHADELLIGDFHQHADFIVLMAGRERQL
ncbi:hypothetical protein D3C81_797270 [compost metagenome]